MASRFLFLAYLTVSGMSLACGPQSREPPSRSGRADATVEEPDAAVRQTPDLRSTSDDLAPAVTGTAPRLDATAGPEAASPDVVFARLDSAPVSVAPPDAGTAATPDTRRPSSMNPVHHWKLDEAMGTVVKDSAPAANGGTLTQGTTWLKPGVPAAKFTNPAALVLDGLTGTIMMERDLSVALGGTASLSCWLNTTQLGVDEVWRTAAITGGDQPGGSDDIFWGFLDRTGKIGLQVGDGPGVTSVAPVSDGKWHHLAMTRNDETGRIEVYLDGKLEGEGINAPGAKGTPFALLGRLSNSPGPTLKGQIDDVRVYDRVLAAAEVQALFMGR